MRCISILTFILILFQADVFAQLSSSSCSLLRTADSLSGIVPEIAQLAMRFYRASSFSIEHHRQKRFLFNSNQRKNTSSSRNDLKSTLIEQMISNSVQDINFTSIAIVLLNNNETANKIRQNIDNEAIIRVILQEIDYEKLGRGLKSAAEKDFDLEQFVVNIINITHMDIIHEELMTNGTLPEWLLKKIHPDLTNHEIHRTFSALKNITNQFVRAFSKSGRFDNFLYNMITQQALAPLSYIIQGVQESKPKTFNQLIEIIIDNFNKVAKESIMTSTNQTLAKTPKKKPLASNVATVDLNDSNEVKLMLYHWSIAIDSMGQTARVMLKSLLKLYCTSSWD